jgi:hypothetical protein
VKTVIRDWRFASTHNIQSPLIPKENHVI